jgi:hypothetical protein
MSVTFSTHGRNASKRYSENLKGRDQLGDLYMEDNEECHFKSALQPFQPTTFLEIEEQKHKETLC